MTLQGKLIGPDTVTQTAIRTQLRHANVSLLTDETSPLDFLIAHLDSTDQVLDKNGDFIGVSNLDSSAITQLLDHHLTQLLLAIQLAVPALKVRGGNIVLIGTLHGLKLLPSPPHFAAVQAALHGITQSLAKELGKDNIRVNLLACGLINDLTTQKLSDTHRQTYLQHCALGRLAQPEEIARAACWYALHNRYVSGQSIVLDGGL